MDQVSVWESDCTKRVVTDVESAAQFLLESWPHGNYGTHLHLTAQHRAIDALYLRVPAEVFRANFIAAAEEAGILVNDSMPPALRSVLKLDIPAKASEFPRR